MRQLTSRQQDWDQVAATGSIDAPGPNDSAAAIQQSWFPRAAGNVPGDTPGQESPFYPGLVVSMAQNLVTAIVRKALPGDSGVDRYKDVPSSFTAKYFVADNTFLLGLRMRAPYRGEATVAYGDSSPALGGPGAMKQPRPRPWVYKGLTTSWPQAPLQWPTFEGD